MNKREYLNQLSLLLNDLEENNKNELLRDFEQHFDQGIMMGRSEEEIAETLGDVRLLAEELKLTVDQPSIKEETIKPIPNGTINRIKVSGLSADINVRRSNDENINYDFYDTNSNANIHNYYVNENVHGDELVLEVIQKEKRLFNFDFGRLVLDVYVPSLIEGSYHSFSGNIEVHQIDCQNLECKSASGDVEIVDGAGNLKASSSSGDIDVSGSNFNRVYLSSVSGDVEFECKLADEIIAKSKSGNVEIECSLVKRCDLDSISGDCQFKGKVSAIQAASKSGNIEVDCGITDMLNLSSISGDIDVFVRDITGISGDCKTVSGDVNLKLRDGYHYNHKHLSYKDESCKMNCRTVSGDITIKD